MKVKKKNNEPKKIPTFAKVIINIFYQIFIFIFFIILILVILYFVYKYGIKYVGDLFYNIKLTDIYFDESKERKFDYNFKINDYIYFSTNFNPHTKFKIVDIFTIDKILNYLFLKVIKENDEDKNVAIISVHLKDQHCKLKRCKLYKYYDPNNIMSFVDEEIKEFKYVSCKKYFIPFYMEYIFIKYNNRDKFNENESNIGDLAQKTATFAQNVTLLERGKNFFDYFGNGLKKWAIVRSMIDYFYNEFTDDDANKFKDIANNGINNDSIRKWFLNLLTKNFMDSDVCNLKLKYCGSKEIDDLNSNDIVFRGIYFEYNDKIYKNEYTITSKNFDKFCGKEILVYNQEEKNLLIEEVINHSNQPNLFLILIKGCINMSSFEIDKKFIDLLSFFFPQMNIFIEEIISIFMENKEIYTSKKIEIKKDIDSKDIEYKKNKLLLLDYNVILYILSNSTDNFLRIVYNNYHGICYFDKSKLIYVKLRNKEEKKKIYNVI